MLKKTCITISICLGIFYLLIMFHLSKDKKEDISAAYEMVNSNYQNMTLNYEKLGESIDLLNDTLGENDFTYLITSEYRALINRYDPIRGDMDQLLDELSQLSDARKFGLFDKSQVTNLVTPLLESVLSLDSKLSLAILEQKSAYLEYELLEEDIKEARKILNDISYDTYYGLDRSEDIAFFRLSIYNITNNHLLSALSLDIENNLDLELLDGNDTSGISFYLDMLDSKLSMKENIKNDLIRLSTYKQNCTDFLTAIHAFTKDTGSKMPDTSKLLGAFFLSDIHDLSIVDAMCALVYDIKSMDASCPSDEELSLLTKNFDDKALLVNAQVDEMNIGIEHILGHILDEKDKDLRVASALSKTTWNIGN